MLCFSFTAAMTPTALSTAIETCAALAIADTLGPNRLKTASDQMDVPLSTLSEGLKGQKHLSLQRLTNLGPVFLLHFCKRVMRHLGGVALSAEEVAMLCGAAQLGADPVNRLTHRKQVA
jgi:hypothetical protein